MNLRLAAAGPLLLASCFSVTHDYSGPREITPGTRLTQPSRDLGPVTADKKANFLFWGLLPINDCSGPQILDEAAYRNHGDELAGVTEVRIHEEQDAVDVIVYILTLGIFGMSTVEVEGKAQGRTGGGAGGTR